MSRRTDMWIVIAAVSAAVLVSACGTGTPSGLPAQSAAATATPSPTESALGAVPAVPSEDMPNLTLTPGVALPVTAAEVCVPGYASSVRNVSDAEKNQVYARYHVTRVPFQHEVDHLISLEIGGSNDIRNLWPEPYAGQWGAHAKDVLENKLHDLVCSGQLSLALAQQQEVQNWVAAYLLYVGGASPSPSASPSGPSVGGYYASNASGAHTIYCADDPGWRSLSPAHLVHFDTLAAAQAHFPTYHLHQPC